ncbi:MAG: type VI secretion system contractile sheath large subunit, partial [Verrucomicrobiota bacterium]
MSEELSPDAQPAAVAVSEATDFSRLIKDNFKPKSDDMEKDIEAGIQVLVDRALEDQALISEESRETIEKYISKLDQLLTEQINLILHHEEFQKLEGAWRGLHYLVNNTATDETLKIRVMNISKKDLGKTLKKFKGARWDKSPIFKRFYEEEYGTPNGEPFGAIVGDYEFDNRPQDVELLGEMAQIAAAAHAPFLSAASPTLMNMDSWRELSNPDQLKPLLETPAHAAYQSLRNSDDSKYLGLTMPRTLARLPYGANTEPVDEFAFEEDTGAADHAKYCWQNSAYALAVNINRSFKDYGWCSRIRGPESGGMVDSLPVHTFTTADGKTDMKCPTEIAIPDRREKELSDCGLIPLCHWKNTDYGVFIGAQSVNEPTEYADPDATASAQLSARLPYLFATCRFAHYLKCIVRDKIGSFASRDDMQKFLNDWIMKYVSGNPGAGEIEKAKKPLAKA